MTRVNKFQNKDELKHKHQTKGVKNDGELQEEFTRRRETSDAKQNGSLLRNRHLSTTDCHMKIPRIETQ